MSADDPKPTQSQPSEAEAEASPAKSQTRVLVVDDERLIADTVTHILNKSGFEAQCVYSGEAALTVAETFCPDILLTDVRMPGKNGVETAILIQQLCPKAHIVLFSGQAGTSPLVEQARRDGHGFTLLPKPIHPRELALRLREL